MSYYRRGYSWESLEGFPPAQTWNPDAAVDQMSEGDALVLDNLIPRPGKLVLRGGIDVLNNFTGLGGFASPLAPIGLMIAGNSWNLGRAVASATADADPWQVVRFNTNNASQLTRASTQLLGCSGGSTVTTFTLANAGLAPGPFSASVGTIVVGLAVDSTLAAVTDQHTHLRQRLLWQLTGNVGVGAAMNQYATAPIGSIHLTLYQNRLWLACGEDTPAAATAHKWNSIYYTNPGAFADVAASWQDPVSGITNAIPIGYDSSDDCVMGFGRLRNSLVVFKGKETFILRGSTPSTYTVSQLSKEVGCIDMRSMVECDAGIYFVSHKGLMFTDGVRVLDMSGSVKRSLIAALQAPNPDNNITYPLAGQCISCALAEDGSIVVSVSYPCATAGVSPIWSGIFIPSTRSWWRLTSALFNQGIAQQPLPGWVFNTAPRRLLSLGDAKIFRWHDEGGLSFLRPSQPGQTFSSSVKLADIDAVGGLTLQIPAVWHTRFARVANPNKKNEALHRLILDYVMSGKSGADVTGGWSVKIVDPSGTDIQPVYRVAKGTAITTTNGGYILTPVPWILHDTHDVFYETTDGDIYVTWDPSNTNGPYIAELHGITLEYQMTSERRP